MSGGIIIKELQKTILLNQINDLNSVDFEKITHENYKKIRSQANEYINDFNYYQKHEYIKRLNGKSALEILDFYFSDSIIENAVIRLHKVSNKLYVGFSKIDIGFLDIVKANENVFGFDGQFKKTFYLCMYSLYGYCIENNLVLTQKNPYASKYCGGTHISIMNQNVKVFSKNKIQKMITLALSQLLQIEIEKEVFKVIVNKMLIYIQSKPNFDNMLDKMFYILKDIHMSTDKTERFISRHIRWCEHHKNSYCNLLNKECTTSVNCPCYEESIRHYGR